jgi:hypothetical protein
MKFIYQARGDHDTWDSDDFDITEWPDDSNSLMFCAYAGQDARSTVLDVTEVERVRDALTEWLNRKKS